MAVQLEGKCFIRQMRDGTPARFDTLSVWRQVGRDTGASAISLRILEFSRGISPGIRNDESDEVLYFLESLESATFDPEPATVFLDGWPYEVRPQTGIYLRPGQVLTVENRGLDPIVFVSSQCPEPVSSGRFLAPLTSPKPGSVAPQRAPLARLMDRDAIPTGDRWYRVLLDDQVGSIQVTQFVGSIPPGRAPDHFHQYEEVLFILSGQGRMWAGETNSSIAAGDCVFLPKGQVHCVENTGGDELRLLGVFYPAGSPSVRYEQRSKRRE
jgi:mannose-6-phosphate isomerase-like protein (cupin superfamily)